ncbi:MAG TPA: YceI family protein [Solirubrobacteraceae bacterium]|nr:YceI family protein [Solirubrobacteraceae bacterium]
MATTAETRQAGILPEGTWEIDQASSTIGFEVRHLKIARVRGRFHEAHAEISIGADGLATIAARVAVASIDTGDQRRDERLRAEDFFDVAHHPTLSFSGVCAPGRAGDVLAVRGEMTMRGLTRPLELLAQPARLAAGQQARVRVSGAVSRRDFGLEWDSAFAAGGLVIDDRIDLRLDLALLLRAPRAGDTPRQ